MVTLTRFNWPLQARLAQSRLAACGIQAFLPDEFTTSLCWHYSILLGGVRRQVLLEDLEDARAVLAEEPQVAGTPILTEHEKVTDRALRTAVLGVLFFPLDFYALWLLVPVLGWRHALTDREWREIVATIVLVGLWLLPILFLIVPKY